MLCTIQFRFIKEADMMLQILVDAQMVQRFLSLPGYSEVGRLNCGASKNYSKKIVISIIQRSPQKQRYLNYLLKFHNRKLHSVAFCSGRQCDIMICRLKARCYNTSQRHLLCSGKSGGWIALDVLVCASTCTFLPCPSTTSVIVHTWKEYNAHIQ